jgi:hypothetical protein
VFENRVLRRIFGPMRDEVIGGWRKLHNEELHNLYPSPSIIRMIKPRRMRCAGHIARMGRRGIPEGKIPLGSPGCRWVDNTKMDFSEIGWNVMDWIDLVQDRDRWRNSCEHSNELLGSIIFWEFV